MTVEADKTDTSEGEGSNLADTVPTRTPEPTATPGPLAREVSEFVGESNLTEETLLWLKVEDWINLGFSILFVLIGYLIGTWTVRWLLPKIVVRTATSLDDRLLEVSGSELRWLIVVFILQFATERLAFLSFSFKNFLADLYFLAVITIVANLSWRLINLAAEETHQRAEDAGRKGEFNSLILLYVWALRFIVIVLATSILLSYFGIDITGIAILLVAVLVIISLAGRDTVADLVAGAMILIDRPFRVGDRIDIPEIDTWGDVVIIGMRSTQVRARNNRIVIIPNSRLGKEQIVNYSYPNPMYRIQSDIGVAYDNDVEQVIGIIGDVVGQVDGVLADQPVQVLLVEFRENDMVFRVRWWSETYQDFYHVMSRVNKAMIAALKKAEIILPYASVVDLNIDPKETDFLSNKIDEDNI
jgi:small-conductance mechanosensitive channel